METKKKGYPKHFGHVHVQKFSSVCHTILDVH